MPPLPGLQECRNLFRTLSLDPRVVAHVEAVARLASDVAAALRARGVPVDVDLVRAGALLHDIGRSRTQGLDHAHVGADLLRQRGYPESVCLCVERHTGGGIDAQEAARLGLPARDYVPRSLEEKIVCQVDNLFEGALRHPVAREVEYLRSRGLAAAADKVRRLHEELSALLGTDLDTFGGSTHAGAA